MGGEKGQAEVVVARLRCGEKTARRLANVLGESLPGGGTVCSAFEDADGHWAVEVHFASPPDEDAVRALVAVALDDDAARALTFERVAAKDWVAASLEGLKPVRAGRFAVHGAHHRARFAATNTIAIEIEAALAFGTGHHGTTRGCLLALEAIAKRARPRRILDVGTGSGVLAIAAARLLHARVVASDIDPRAVESARSNARLNRAGGRITFITAAGVARIPGRYDLIFANILLAPLQRMAAPLTRKLAPGGRVILSGLLASHAHAALAAYRAQGLALEQRFALEGWVTLVMRRGRL